MEPTKIRNYLKVPLSSQAPTGLRGRMGGFRLLVGVLELGAFSGFGV